MTTLRTAVSRKARNAILGNNLGFGEYEYDSKVLLSLLGRSMMHVRRLRGYQRA